MFQEAGMITKVKCGTNGCELKDRVFTTTALFLNKIAPLDGPFPCPKCDKPMKVVERIPANYKGGSGAKRMPRTTTSKPTAKKPVGKKKVKKAITLKGIGKSLGVRYKKPTKNAGPRKRGPSKS
jgi:hypothetical protein